MRVRKSKKVLVVDDDNDILNVIRIILEDEGYEVSTLDSGREVLGEVASNMPDLILLDVMLCGMDGRDICKNLKSHALYKLIPVIMISASHNLQGLLEDEGSADGFISKPFDIDELIAVVEGQFPTKVAV
jgi:two-component system response regulator VicR